MTTDQRETHEITFSAQLVEELDDDGGFEPIAVIVNGASFLAASAITDIAQETVNSYFGSYDHKYLALRPDSEYHQQESVRIEILKRG